MQATEIDFSAPTMPSLTVTTRRRFTPHGTSCSFLQAVTQMQETKTTLCRIEAA